MMQTSSEIAQLAAALAKAPGKSKTHPRMRRTRISKTDMRPSLRCGQPFASRSASTALPTFSPAHTTHDAVEIETMLVHESGERISSMLAMPLGQFTAQAVGSAISYGRRYSLMAMIGLAAEDDDANLAQAAAPKDNGKIVNPKTGKWIDPRSSMQAKARGDWDGKRTDGGFNPDNLVDNLRDCHSAVAVQKLWDDYRANTYPGWPRGWPGKADAIFAAALAEHRRTI